MSLEVANVVTTAIKDWSRGYVAYVKGSIYTYAFVDCSEGREYYFTANIARFMHSNVYTKGYYLARIDATCTLTTAASIATGVWSPDSVPESGVLPSTDYLQ